MTIFLVTVGFVFSLVPGMFQPFETETGRNMVAVDRGAALLAEDLLLEESGEGPVVNETCAAEFFDENGDVGECQFDADGGDLQTALGIEEDASVNVTLESNGNAVTLQGADGPVVARAGRAPPPTADVVVAKRVVLLDGRRATLLVRVW